MVKDKTHSRNLQVLKPHATDVYSQYFQVLLLTSTTFSCFLLFKGASTFFIFAIYQFNKSDVLSFTEPYSKSYMASKSPVN